MNLETDPKVFVERVQKTEFPNVIFALKAKGIGVKEYYSKLLFGKLERVMKETKGNIDNMIIDVTAINQ